MKYIKRILPLILVNEGKILRNRMRFPKAIINTPHLGKGAVLGKEVALNEEVVVGGGSIIGDFSYINKNTIVHNTKIGKYCSISFNCVIGAEEHPIENLSTSPKLYQANPSSRKAVEIGNDVWIGANVVIKSGVKIGNGAIIGAGSIVTKDIPDYAIAVGVPAKIVRERKVKEWIIENNYSNWWDFSEEEIREIIRREKIEE